MQVRTSVLTLVTAAAWVGCGPVVPPGADGGTRPPGSCIDSDGDGVPGTGDCTGVAVVDCDDRDPAVHPGAPEACNGLDDNCDGQVDEGLDLHPFYRDSDGDGYGTSQVTGTGCGAPPAGSATKTGDGDDANPAVHPGAVEVCNGVDDDSNGQIDDGLTFRDFYPDLDQDGFGDATAAPVHACQSQVAGRVPNKGDCDDHSAAVHPGAAEACNGVDDDCNGLEDDGLAVQSYYLDADGDGFGDALGVAVSACGPVAGRVANNTDCDDSRAAVHPGVAEVCNGLDDDCSGAADDGLLFQDYYPDSDADGFGAAGSTPEHSCQAVQGKVPNTLDCDDTRAAVHPSATEVCNGKDDDCDGQVDNRLTFTAYYPDTDGDGFGSATASSTLACLPPAGMTTNHTDCDDTRGAVHPGAVEICNGLDDDCNGQVDDAVGTLTYYPDADGDGFGDSAVAGQLSCQPVAGKVANAGDCDDTRAAVHPGAIELCNVLDDDCNGLVDDGPATNDYYPDADGDGYGSASVAAQASCGPVPGKVPSHSDCNDSAAAIHPGAAEVCDGYDDDCNSQVDEGNPGGGAACATGQAGVCAPGTTTCQGGALGCLRNVGPSAELCDGLDNDCNNQIDETFADLATGCSAGQGVCFRTGVFVCRPDQTATVCGATEGPPTALACDGLDNNCDGVVDEPALDGTAAVTTVVWTDLEVSPYYYSATSCAGGVNGSGTDALAGGAVAMAGGLSGISVQRLDATGAPVGSATSVAGYTYTDVAIAQAEDGYVIAGIWAYAPEIDLYYVDSTGAARGLLYSQFQAGTGNSIDSLRVVRGNGKRVVVLWREVVTGPTPATRLRLARVEPAFDGTNWQLRNPGGVGAPINSAAIPVAATVKAGLGADSTHVDWALSQACPSAASLRTLGVAYLSSSASLNRFTVKEDGSGKSVETVVATESGTRTLTEPEIAYFRSGAADDWFIAYVTPDTSSPAQADLDYWLTTAPSWHYAYLQFGTQNGADSIHRPRASVTSTRIWLTALRAVADPSGFDGQVMTRTIDFFGDKDPAVSTVEQSATQGACGADPWCRPGNKDGLTCWAATGKLFYSASGATPSGTFVSGLSCQ